MTPTHRDPGLEKALQGALDDGSSVWAVGDIHGYREEFEILLDKLELTEGDMVICVGDLIDRGPDSQGVLSIVSESDCINWAAMVVTSSPEAKAPQSAPRPPTGSQRLPRAPIWRPKAFQ